MNPLYSWAVLLVVVGGLTWHYTGRPNVIAKLAPSATSAKLEEKLPEKPRSKKPKPKRTLAGEVSVSSEEGAAVQTPSQEGNVSKKRKIARTQTSATATLDVVGSEKAPTKDSGELSNKEFAKQFAQARAGTQLASVDKAGRSQTGRKADQRTVHSETTRAAALESPNPSTGASSTNGADADDDLSPVGSPLLEATPAPAISKAGDISDMLEGRTSGPAILRLTDTKGTLGKEKPKQQAKPFEVAETKKQRQQRQKREAQKMLNEEAERERRKLMERQSRGARMAEGTSAQTKSNAFKVPTTNAWSAGNDPVAQNAIRQAPVGGVPLLDTFEPEVEFTTTNGGSVNTKLASNIANHGSSSTQSVEGLKREIGVDWTNALAASTRENGVDQGSSARSNKSWAEELPSEEEQLRLINQEDAWKTVGNKKDKKKSTKILSREMDTASDASGIDPPLTNGGHKKQFSKPQTRAVESGNRFDHIPVEDSGLQDSEWAA